MNIFKKICLGAALLVASVGSASAASVYQLGFAIDASGSMGTTNFNLEKNGLANAINNLIPTDSTVEISVVLFNGGSSLVVSPTLIDSAATLSSVVGTIQGLAYTGGTTCMSCAINTLTSALTGSSLFNTPDARQIINITTDGSPNSTTATTTASAAAQAAGIDLLSFEAVGNFSSTSIANMQSWAFPGPVGSTASGTNGFVVEVNSFDDYADAITAKIAAVTNQDGDVPVPAPLALLGLGLAAMGLRSRRNA